jgi:hypothetical protein
MNTSKTIVTDGPKNSTQIRKGTALLRLLWLVQSFIGMIGGCDVWERQTAGNVIFGWEVCGRFHLEVRLSVDELKLQVFLEV